MRIEVGTPQRLDAIARLFDAYRVFYGQPSDPAGSRQFIGRRMENGDSRVLCALDGAEAVVGFTQLYPCFSSVGMERIWILNDLFVDPSTRNKGVGRMLLAAARDHAIASGAIRLELATQKTNTAAQSLYESTGWIREEAFYRYELPLES